MSQFTIDLDAVLNELREMLIRKNEGYGNSALEPVRIFSRADSVEQIKVRIDDKLSRLSRGKADATEDTEKDLLGYLILLRIARLIEARAATKPDPFDGLVAAAKDGLASIERAAIERWCSGMKYHAPRRTPSLCEEMWEDKHCVSHKCIKVAGHDTSHLCACRNQPGVEP